MTRLPLLEAMLDRQVKSWEVRRRLADAGGDEARRALAHLDEGPWLSISRQWGSGGIEIAQSVGSELGWLVYDREILTSIAEHTHSREQVLSRLDAEAVGPFRDYVSQLIAGDPARASYLQQLTQVIWGLARQGNSVIVGRGANWFLDPRFGLRLRVIAPLDERVRRVAGAEGVDQVEARRRVTDHDERRRGFVRQSFQREIDDPTGYDLVVNTALIGVEGGAAAVLAALRGKLG